ncbi:MAG: TolC family protein, partial [Planctomycetes bacterium]|nr:TolC family protein [Planctomycetota bacterium]
MKFIWIHILACLCIAVRLVQAEGESEFLYLDEIVRLCTDASEDSKLSQSAEFSARQEQALARAPMLPQMTLQGQLQSMDRVPSVSFGGAQVSIGDKDVHRVSARVSQLLWDSGESWQGLLAARRGRGAAELRTGRTRELIAARVNYYQYLEACVLVRLSEKTLASSRAHLERVENFKAIGKATQTDVLEAELRLYEDEQDQLESTQARSLLLARLRSALNLPDAQLPDPPATLERPAYFDLELSECLAAARVGRSDVNALQKEAESQTSMLSSTRRGALPKISAFYNREYTSDQFAAARDSWNMGLTMDLPLLQGGAWLARVREAENQ